MPKILSYVSSMVYVVMPILGVTCFVRNFSLPLLLLGEVRKGHLQHGQV